MRTTIVIEETTVGNCSRVTEAPCDGSGLPPGARFIIDDTGDEDVWMA
ncbi:hypothetical protein [Burkholderia ambifaria]|nr:hypothetical protein [Burkholderia ambifaria]UEP48560.1 hypothetical protein LMA00_01980 [Burkholderia ambifaria]